MHFIKNNWRTSKLKAIYKHIVGSLLAVNCKQMFAHLMLRDSIFQAILKTLTITFGKFVFVEWGNGFTQLNIVWLTCNVFS